MGLDPEHAARAERMKLKVAELQQLQELAVQVRLLCFLPFACVLNSDDCVMFLNKACHALPNLLDECSSI